MRTRGGVVEHDGPFVFRFVSRVNTKGAKALEKRHAKRSSVRGIRHAP